MDYTYRLYLIRFLAGMLVPPLTLTFMALSLFAMIHPANRLPGLICISLYIASVPIFWALKSIFAEWRYSVNARKMGASVVPLIKGRRWGSIDIVQR